MSETPEQTTERPPENGEGRCLAQLQRERADFLNYKHRVDRERADERERARHDTLRELLPIIDDLDRALSQMPDDLRGHPWVEGVVLAHQRFLDGLRRLGVEQLGAAGERFDPAVHEAVVYHEQPTAREQHVQRVVRPGYRIGPQLLRPAQVVVTGPPGNGVAGRPAAAPEGRHDENGQSHWH
ncbi:MAG TPA: nucleotide exchange factor GrpE [Chloroflexota bacterium]|jgi:molecular chaperone GrpE|nr:nucleotide exchange factor GrpE [Chloroflexota bacterium]